MDNLKPFNLERALAGDPVVTRDGRTVTDFHLFPASAEKYPLYACAGDRIYGYTVDGHYFSSGSYSPYDLFMAPKTETIWINLYFLETSTGKSTWLDTFPSEEAAESTFRKDVSLNSDVRRKGGKAHKIEFEA